MPEYDYICNKCEYKWSEYRRMAERKEPLFSPCPSCSHLGAISRIYETGGFIDPGIIQADKNMEKTGVLDELNRLKEHHPHMKWKG
jgi:putative FmdB family regulatory protein